MIFQMWSLSNTKYVSVRFARQDKITCHGHLRHNIFSGLKHNDPRKPDILGRAVNPNKCLCSRATMHTHITNRIIHHYHTPILLKASQNYEEALIYANNTGVMKPDFREPFSNYRAEIQRRKILVSWIYWRNEPSRNETTHRKKSRGSWSMISTCGVIISQHPSELICSHLKSPIHDKFQDIHECTIACIHFTIWLADVNVIGTKSHYVCTCQLNCWNKRHHQDLR